MRSSFRTRTTFADFDALRSAVYKAPHRLVFFAFDLLQLDGQDLRQAPLMERRAALRKLIEPDPRSLIHFSDHVDCDGAQFFKAAAELGLEGIVSKRAASRYRGGPSRSYSEPAEGTQSGFEGPDDALVVAKPPLRALMQGSAQWLRPELRVRVRHLKARGCCDTQP